MIIYKEIERKDFALYDSVDMSVYVKSNYKLEKINRGLGGIRFIEESTKEYKKDFGPEALQCADKFDISNWLFLMAFDGERPVGGTIVAAKTKEVNMLGGRKDLALLWDIRVTEEYKHKGIGQSLFKQATEWAKKQGMRQMKIECQNNNVPACKFYHKQGAVLSEINEYAYYLEEDYRQEVQFIWYLDLKDATNK